MYDRSSRRQFFPPAKPSTLHVGDKSAILGAALRKGIQAGPRLHSSHQVIVAVIGCTLAWGCTQQKPEEQPIPDKPVVVATEAPEKPKAKPPAKDAVIEDPMVLTNEPDKRGPRDLVIVAVGDVSQPATQWVEDTERLKDKVFDPTRHLTTSGDLAFMNLENPVTALRPKLKKTYAFTSPPERLDWYFKAGFNMYSLANNHIADADQPGIDKTIEHLEEYAKKNGTPVYHAGAGKTPEEGLGPKYFKPEGKELTIAFFSLGFSPSDNVGKFWDEALEAKIREADKKADIVFVSVHAGKEYVHIPEKDLQERYRSWVDWGADLVIGHHTHCIRPVEVYKDALIYHGLGNYVFMSRTVRHRKMGAKLYGMLTRIVIHDGRVAGAEIWPTWVNNSDDWTIGDQTMPNAAFVPQLLTGPFADQYFEDLNAWARKSGSTEVHRGSDYGIVRIPPAE